MKLVNQLTKTVLDSRCAVDAARLNRYGTCSALTLQVSGSWDALARLESALPPQARKQGIQVTITRGTDAPIRPQSLPYVAYVCAAYRPDILNELCQFFANHQVELESINCDTYHAPQTGGTMLNATLTVTLSPGTQISWLRDQFLDFADALNLDALIEPWRPQTPP